MARIPSFEVQESNPEPQNQVISDQPLKEDSLKHENSYLLQNNTQDTAPEVNRCSEFCESIDCTMLGINLCVYCLQFCV